MSLNIGDAAPEFSGENVLTGETHNLSDYQNKLIFLVFSGPSWCPPCQLEAPVLQQLWEEEYKLSNVQFLMVSCFGNENPNQFKNAVEQFGFTFPCLLNPAQAATALYDVGGVPTMYVISKDKVICNAYVGLPSSSLDVIAQHIRDMLTNCGAQKNPKLDISKWKAVMTILFGVTGDGGGLAITPGGKPIPIDPWGPLSRISAEQRDMYLNFAIAELSNSLADYKTGADIKAAALKSAEASMRKITAAGTAKVPVLKNLVEKSPKKK